MKPFIVLVISTIIAVLCIRLVTGIFDFPYAFRIGMSVMLVFTGIAHFAFTNGMVKMLPQFIPLKKELVWFTGILEIAAAIGLQIHGLIPVTSWLLIIFFILIIPANINAAVKGLDYQKGTYDGAGVGYLWFRVPLQVVFIGWVYWSGLWS